MSARSVLLGLQHLLDPTLEHTLTVAKLDGYARSLAGETLRRIKAKGYMIKSSEFMIASRELLVEYCANHKDRSSFEGLPEFMSSGPVVVIAVEGQRVVEGMHVLMGSADPTTAPTGTTRGDLGRARNSPHMGNLIHGSGSVDNATREISLWFPKIY